MKFRKINDTTINCIITQDDLRKHGIDLDDLFDRKKNAVEFIKRIILKAASSVNMNMKNDYTSMRISVLPDQSVSLTISQDPAESAKIKEHKDLASGSRQAGGKASEKASDRAVQKNVGNASKSGTYVFRFYSIMETLPSCRILSTCRGLESSLYFVRESGFYYLVISRDADAGEDYALGSPEHSRIVRDGGRHAKVVQRPQDAGLVAGLVVENCEHGVHPGARLSAEEAEGGGSRPRQESLGKMAFLSGLREKTRAVDAVLF